MGGDDDRHGDIQPRRLRRQVEVQQVRPVPLGQRSDDRRHRVEGGGIAHHPVEGRIAPVERRHRLRFPALGGVGRGAEAGQDRLVASRVQGGGEIESVSPDAADGVERHHDAASGSLLAARRPGRHAGTVCRSRTLRGAGRSRFSLSHSAKPPSPSCQPMRACQPVASRSRAVSATNQG